MSFDPGMANPRLLVFDSGIGGLSVLRSIRAEMPEAVVTYLADDAGFPYGDWGELALTNRIVRIMEKAIALFMPHCVVIACNTASTLVLPALRSRFDVPFVGTVPAIKPAAEQTRTGMVSVLATPGTVKRDYTFDLIRDFASDIRISLVGASGLARLAENYVTGGEVQTEALLEEIRPCFVELDGKRTDTVVLGCTHYPFLLKPMADMAPWPVIWIDPSDAIARRVKDLIIYHGLSDWKSEDESLFTATSGRQPPAQVMDLIGSMRLQVRNFRQLSSAFGAGL
ncbi:glutamate racemase [Coralliovum pocilloporae]|uniref:glutamate racemase n=1 Tax=Coralliovum pocilloporae TaxID=3066369 RepID=UPI003307AA43